MKRLFLIILAWLVVTPSFAAQITIDDISNNTYPKLNFIDCDSNFDELYTFMDGATWQGTLTNSAGLLAALDDETGTGLAVFNTSPTLVTPALGTPSAVVLTNGTGYEGTAVISTGEAGGTKYLREDGDGTSSWQTPAGAGDLLADGTVPLTANWDVGAFTLTGTRFISDIAIGTAPFGVTSTTVVPNLNVEQLDGNTWEEPEAIGGTTPAAATFTSVSVLGTASGGQYGYWLEDTDLGSNFGGWGIYGALTHDTIYAIPLAAPTAGQIMAFAAPGNQTMSDGTTKSVSVGAWAYPGASLTPVTGTAAGFAAGFTGANLYGGTYVVNTTGTVQLPAMLVNMNFTIITLGDIAVIIDTNVADGYLLDGVTGAEGANITNLSAAGDIAVIQYYTADDWLMTTNGWTAE